MVWRRRPCAVPPLIDRERFVEDGAVRRECVRDRIEQIALQVPRHDDEVERRGGQRMPRQVGAPGMHAESARGRGRHGVGQGVLSDVHAERFQSGAGEQHRVAAASHGDVERATGARREPFDPLGDERRRDIIAGSVAQALLTAILLGLGGLVTTAVFGLWHLDIARHITFGIFSTFITLLGHSMMMFYLIGKGKAVKDAMAEHQLSGDYYRRIAAARKPVFSIGTYAMAATMAAAILGASVDTGVLPPIVHGALAYGAVILNLAALKIEIGALGASGQVVDEVNRLIGA